MAIALTGEPSAFSNFKGRQEKLKLSLFKESENPFAFGHLFAHNSGHYKGLLDIAPLSFRAFAASTSCMLRLGV